MPERDTEKSSEDRMTKCGECGRRFPTSGWCPKENGIVSPRDDGCAEFVGRTGDADWLRLSR